MESSNRILIKEKLLTTINHLKMNRKNNLDYPITDLEISQEKVNKIENLTQQLEKNNPFFRPILYGSVLLDGKWLLQYSNAREIRSLSKLPLGLKVDKIYQIIDINTASFENQAFVKHSSKLLSGYVKVTATFEPDLQTEDKLPNEKINIQFNKRFIAINKILGIKTPFFEPIKTANAKNPPDRVPSLNITYIDETMRIGRGGEGSLFILTKEL